MPFLLTLLIWIVLEAWVLGRLFEHLGPLAVGLWLLAAVVIGVSVIKRQGLRTIREVQLATARGELPTAVLLEGVVSLIAGLLLIVPGVLSDVLALPLLFLGLRRSLATRLGSGLAKARPDLKQPVTLEGQYRRRK